MSRFSHWANSCAALALAACSAPSPDLPPQKPLDPQAQVERVGRLVERYWAETAAMTPWYSWSAGEAQTVAVPPETIAPQALADLLAIERRYLAELQAVPRSALDAPAQLTYDIFLRDRQVAIEGFTYPLELLPIDPFGGWPLEFALLAAESAPLAASSERDYEKWRTRSASFVGWSGQAIANLREGVRRGYTVPRVVVERSLAPLEALGKDTPANFFYRGLEPAAADPEHARLAAAAATFVKAQLLPAYRALHEFLRSEYLPRARLSVGWLALPLGEAWYAYLIKRNLGVAPPPAELHAIGRAEVDRVQQRLRALLAEAAAGADVQAFAARLRHEPSFAYADPDALMASYADLKRQVAATATVAFADFPHADFAVRPDEAFRAGVLPPLSYRPRAPNGLLAAVLYVNTAALDEQRTPLAPSSYLREAVPGNVYQAELQRERADLPRFRRFGGAPAFIAGWGQYAATLGEELGLYRDVETREAALRGQLDCAVGMVVDTGVHALGWTRQQALDYYRGQWPIEEATAALTVDRIIARPAEAVACTAGYLAIQALRVLAQSRLGAAFDARAFHHQMLDDGAIPLDLLEAKIRAWLGNIAGAAAVAPAGVAPSRKMD